MVLVTHFMDEAEELCDRPTVIDNGRIAAIDTPQGLVKRLGLPVRVHFRCAEQPLPDLASIAEVQQVDQRGTNVTVVGTGPVLALVAARLVEHGILPDDLRAEQPTLEDAFIALTGRTLGE